MKTDFLATTGVLQTWPTRKNAPGLERLFHDGEALNDLLVSFGREMYEGMRARGQYVDFLLGIADLRRGLRRRLQVAWDFNTLWRTLVPGQNRLAMPLLVLQAMVAVALLWGWPLVAAHFLLGFGAILRPSEHLLARRAALILPRDHARPPLEPPLYLKVGAPKGAWAGARSQVARCDDLQTLRLWDALAVGANAEDALWPLSLLQFSRRWAAICLVLGLPAQELVGLTPASLRGGGATLLFEATEDLEYVRRRGRWSILRTCEIYVQEVSGQEFLAP